MKIIIYLIPLLLLTGCGHNAAVNSKGWGIDLSWQTDSYMPSVRLGYWDNQTAVIKENAQAELVSNGQIGVDVNGQKVETAENNNGAKGVVGSKVKLTTKQQTNGYVKDLLSSTDIKKQNVDMAQKIYKNSQE